MWMRSRNRFLGRIEITGGFLLVVALFYYLDNQNIFFWAATAGIIHELGHALAIYGLGGKISGVRVTAAGAEMALSAARPLGAGARCLAAAAGPVSNLAAAALAARMGEGWFLFAGLNLGLAAFNLLPMAQLDGGQIIYHLTALLWSSCEAERVMSALSWVTALALLLAGGLALWITRTNFTLLLTAIWLSASLWRGEG